MEIINAVKEDLNEILNLQKLCYRENALRADDFSIQPLSQTIEEITGEFSTNIFLKIMSGSRITGSVRGYVQDGTGYIGKLIVHPEFQNKGRGTALLLKIEESLLPVKRYELFTGSEDKKNIYLYTKHGYNVFNTKVITSKLSLVFLEKII